MDKPRRRTKPTPKDEAHHVWICHNCEGDPQFNTADFKTHIKTVHDLDAKTPGTKRMRRHLDAKDWYQSDFDWTFDNGLRFTESIRSPRNPYWSEP